MNLIKTIALTLRDLFTDFRKQKVSPALILALLLFILALIFAFLTFNPVLSPFIYPLF